MRELEQRLREASHRDLPEALPVDGFASLQRRMGPSEKGRRRRPIVLLFLLLSGLVLLVVWWAYPAPATPASPVQAMTAEPVVTDPSPAPLKRAGRASLTKEGSANSSSSVSTPTNAKLQAAVTVLPPTYPLPQRSNAQDTVLNAAPSSVVTAPITPPGKARSLPSTTPAYVSIPPRPHPFDTLSHINPPSLLPRPDRLKAGQRGNWDLSVSFYPTGNKQQGYSTEWATRATDPFRGYTIARFNVEGRSQELYSSFSHELDYRITNPIFQLRINRQTRGMLRYGIGATYYRRRDDQIAATEKLIPWTSDYYFTASQASHDLLLASANLGLTFRRQSKLQPWVNLSIQAGIGAREKRGTFLVNETEQWPQSGSEDQYNYLTGSSFPLLPVVELGVQYLLTGHWSVGVNLGGVPSQYVDISITPGAEVRYRW